MKHVFIAALLAAAASAEAGPFGADYGFDEVYGVVQSEREAPPNTHPAWLAELFEHAINPETRVRDERSTALVQREARQPEPGQRRPEAIHQPRNRKEQS